MEARGYVDRVPDVNIKKKYKQKGRRFSMSSQWFYESYDCVWGTQNNNNNNNNNPGRGGTGGREISNPAKTTTALKDVS